MPDEDLQGQVAQLIQDNLQHQAQNDQNFMQFGLMKARSNLFFDDNSMIEYLASERFPNDPSASLRYSYQDGELVFRDHDETIKPVFAPGEDVGWLERSFVPNIVPATTLVADIGGGMAGATAGFKAGANLGVRFGIRHPAALAALSLGGAAIGGFTGNFLIGGTARTGREALIDQFYNLPPEEIAAAYQDLMVSSGFSAIPLGAGPTKNIANKFVGREDSLKYLMNLRATNQEIIDEAAEMGIRLTAPEAAQVATRGVSLQYFLSMQPQLNSARQFYNSRAAQTREAVEAFAETLGSGTSQFGDVGARVANAAKRAMTALAERRRTRATRLYDGIRNAPEPVNVDTSAIIKDIDDRLANPELDTSVREAYEGFKKALFDDDGNQIQNLMSLHDRRAGQIETLIKANLGDDAGTQLISLRENLTSLFDMADDTYRLARRVYDPTKPALQMVERSAIGRLSNLMTDRQTSRAVSQMFDPNVSVQSLRNAKRVLGAVDADAWRDAKKMFVVTKLDDLMRQSIDQGLPQFQQFFAKSNVNRMMQELLEPAEYQSFSSMIEMIGKAMSIPKGSSATQPFLAIERQLSSEAAGLGTKALQLSLAALRLPGRILTGTVGEDVVGAIASRQADAYYQTLSDAIFDPDSIGDIQKAYQYFMPMEYGMKQGAIRGVTEGVDVLTEEGDRPYTPTEGQRERIIQQLQQEQEALDQSPQASLDVDIFQGLGAGPAIDIDPSMSPTILPSASDREIAMRRNSQRSGIGSLV